MNSIQHFRARLASLWLSQVARTLADNALRVYVLVRIAEEGQQFGTFAWHLTAALLVIPAVLFAPFNGALANSLPKRWVLTAAAVFCTIVVAIFAGFDGPWLACWALIAVGAAIYGPTRYAILPAAAVDSHIPLTRVNGWIEMGSVAAIVGGLVIGVYLEGSAWLGVPAAAMLAICLNFLASITALPTSFPADVRRPESAGQAVAGFFRDAGRIWRDFEARNTLLALAGLRAVVTGATGAFLAMILTNHSEPMQARIESSLGILAGVLLGAAGGSVLAGAQRHFRRALGLVPLGITGLVIGLGLAALGDHDPSYALCTFVGAMGGLMNVPLAAAYQIFLPADARGNGMAIRNMCDYAMMAVMSALLFALAAGFGLGGSGQLWVVTALAAVGAVLAWYALFRETLEQIIEIVIWPIYRIKGHGPGLDAFPLRGPLLVVANHAAWMDPIWLAKVLPRTLRAMLTSTFYDVPIFSWIMRNVARSIRVQYSTYRREAPELQEAIAALDLGECVVLFPEGSLRKSETRPLRHFGQGVWHILTQRPQTPVVVCWIEGNWGSFFSYFNGPPTKNKRLDFWRHIDVAVGEAEVLPSEVLVDLKSTRAYLEKRCRDMRGVLGLEVPRADGEAEGEPDP